MPANSVDLTVGEGEAGIRLDQLLAEPLGSRSAAQSVIDSGQVQVNGVPQPKRYVVRPGDRVQAQLPQPSDGGEPEDSPPAQFEILYEDPHLLVVDKPAGVVVHPARGHRSGTLAQALASRGKGGEPLRSGIVHRLDRDTSGLLVVAKTERAHRALKELLSARQITREYLALVDGHPSAKTGTIDAPIGRDRRDRLRISLDTDSPREARTHFEVLELLPSATRLRVKLDTGRTHQIRVHMAAIGHPVSGDPLYGVAGRFGLGRQFLHAERLAFRHPLTGLPVDVHSPLPADLVRGLEQAARASPSF